jgi:neocarzinostatin family protein
MTVRARGALALLATALLVGACSNHSGLRKLHPTDEASSAVASAPTGLAGSAPASTSAKPTPSRPRSTSPAASTPAAPTAASTGTTRPVHHRPAAGPSATPARSSRPARTSAAAPPLAPRGPGLAASPSSGLNGGQRVQVTGARFAAGQPVTLRECRTANGSCPLYLARVTAGGDGSFTEWVWVSSVLGLDSCGANGCMIAGVRADGSTAATVRISFG